MTLDQPRTTARALKVEDLVEEVLRGDVRIPDFQRPLRWKRSDELLLIDSVLRGYPIGALLFWKRDAPPARVRLGALLIDAPASPGASFIVDGQQRIAALVGALAPRDLLHLPAEMWVDLETEAVSARTSELSVPTHVLGDNERLLAWLDSWPHRQSRPELVRKAYALSKRLREYQLPAYVVENAEESAVAIVFDRLNTSGKPLKRADVFRAIERATSSEPGRLEELQKQVRALAFGELRAETVLQAVMAVAGHDVTKPPPRNWPRAAQARAFSDAARGLSSAIIFLKRTLGIPHAALMPYSLPIVVLTRVFNFYGELSHRNLVLLARWFWRATLRGALRGDNVTLVGRFMNAVQPGDADEAIQTLLATVDRTIELPTLSPKLDLHRASSRVEVLALLQFHPRQLHTGEPLDPSTMLMHAPLSKLLQPIAPPKAAGPWSKSLANRVFHPFVGKNYPALLASAEALSSHALTPADIEQGADAKAMLERRAHRIHQRMAAWLSDAAGLEQSDRPALGRLLADSA